MRRCGPSSRQRLLVEPRILRRVIRLDRRLAGLGLFVPHRKTYTIERDRLFAFVESSELELPPNSDLPRAVILIAKPTDEESLESAPAEQSLRHMLRLLFHSQVHLELDRRMEGQPSSREFARGAVKTSGPRSSPKFAPCC